MFRSIERLNNAILNAVQCVILTLLSEPTNMPQELKKQHQTNNH